MKPPQCDLCRRRFDTDDGGGLVRFRDVKSLPDGMTGHPHGVEWFCKRHYEAAEGFRELTYAEAEVELRRIYGRFGWSPRWLAWIRRRL